MAILTSELSQELNMAEENYLICGPWFSIFPVPVANLWVSGAPLSESSLPSSTPQNDSVSLEVIV